ncbi:NlpC/P60 family protein [Geodermatophilus poikilotrophus]|uniref:Cell wall-associated hydrolase, NlpC family n=1 Tax=Geodermatophilus poikilotrophus TaxID=1333667 RepID=A0A1I0IHB0_9ACTN|nr:NlpC/P60 family protein [Geodermatophilus poikilotrophus]SET96289.1 Cell wall-associated hydrolase, NlpC family [Geodermatophilus poikilotrophus]
MPAPRSSVRTAAARPARTTARTGTTRTRTAGTGTAGARTAAPRPPLTAQEAQALRAVLAARAAATPDRAAAPSRRTSTGRSSTGRSSTGRRPGSATRARTSRKRRTTSARRAPLRRWLPTADGRRWRVRLSLAALGLVLPVLAGLVSPGTQATSTAAEPTDTTGLALAAQGSLLDAATRYRALERDLAARHAELASARAAEQSAQRQATAARATVGTGAAGLYRASAEARNPLLQLDVRAAAATPDVLHGTALAERVAQELEVDVVLAERAGVDLTLTTRRVTVAEAALATVRAQAAAVLAEVRAEVGGLRTDVAAQLAALGTARAAAAQQDANQAALRRWQEHLGVLALAGVESPPAADLADPTALPAGLSPALDGSGQPIPGVAWAVAGNRPVTVLPAETVAAVSSALAQVGKPFVPGGTGPDAYDCGGLAAASWLLAGYAIPTAAGDQWAHGAAVPLSQLQIGDLVHADGGQDVGVYLGEGQVVAASAAGYQVGVRPVGDASAAVRVTLPAPAQPNAALPAGTAGRGACGAPPAPVGPVSPAWGGWSNGTIPATALCPIARGHALRCDAAAGYAALADAYRAAFGSPLCITDSYRSRGAQVTAFRAKPALAAVPGTSNHGWALAVDLCGGVNVAGTVQSAWMAANAGRFGFVQPDWARQGGEKPEPWHWEFGHLA